MLFLSLHVWQVNCTSSILRRAGTCTNTCKLNGMEKEKKNTTKQTIKELTLST